MTTKNMLSDGYHPGYQIADVVKYSIDRDMPGRPGRIVIDVSIECPNGEKAGPRTQKPRLHHHGWVSLTEWGGHRAAHCVDGSDGYQLHWPGGLPADVIEAVHEIQRMWTWYRPGADVVSDGGRR